jgi:fumarate hydratase subunit beta
MIKINLPVENDTIAKLKIGDSLLISGKIYTGRDAVLPKVCEAIKNGSIASFNFNLVGSAIFHTAVSPAGIGPTSSNKVEIEESFPDLSKYGVKFHLGKGKISDETVSKLNEYNSVYAVVAPVSAYLKSKVISQKVVAFKELGMEAMNELEVKDFPAVVAAVHGKSIYQ